MTIRTVLFLGHSRSSALRFFAGVLSILAFAFTPARAQVTFLGDISAVPTIALSPNKGLAVDGHGNLYLSEFNGNVRKIAPNGSVTTLLSPSTLIDGVGLSNANSPNGLVLDSFGNLYIADTGNNRILKYNTITNAPATVVTIPFIAAGASTLSSPKPLAIDAAGDLFIVDYPSSYLAGTGRILRLNADGATISVITSASFPPNVNNGQTIGASLAVSPDGNTLYYALVGNTSAPSPVNQLIQLTNITQLNPTATLINPTLPPNPNNPSQTGLSLVDGLALDASGDLYISSYDNQRVFKLTPSGSISVVSVVVDDFTEFTVAHFSMATRSIAIDSGGTVYGVDSNADRIDRIALTSINFGDVPVGTTSLTRTLQFSVGTGSVIRHINALTFGTTGTDFVLATPASNACSVNATAPANIALCTVTVTFNPSAPGRRGGAIQIIDSDTNIDATIPLYGVGTAPLAVFPTAQATSVLNPNSSILPGVGSGVTADDQGNLYLADKANNRILKVAAGVPSIVTIVSNTLPFFSPSHAAIDPEGHLFVADTGNNYIVEINPGGFAAPLPTSSAFNLSNPTDVAVDGAGNVFVADTGHNRIASYPIFGSSNYNSPYVVYTGTTPLSPPHSLAVDNLGDIYFVQGSPGQLWVIPYGGVAAQVPVTPGISSAGSVAVDAGGTIYVVDTGTQHLLAINAQGSATVMPTTGVPSFGSPSSVSVDHSGNVYVSDTTSNTILRLSGSTPPPLTFIPTPVGQLSTDSPQTVPLWNAGNLPLTLSNLTFPANFPSTGGSSSVCSTPLSLIPATDCNVSIGFIPPAIGLVSGTVTLTDNSFNGTTQNINVSGTGALAQVITFTQPVSPVVFGVAPVTLMATSNAGLPVTFTVLSGPATVNGTTLTINGAGTIIVAANAPAGNGYAAAPQAQVTIVVNQATPVLTWATPAPIAYGTALSNTQLDAVASVPGTFTYTPIAGIVLHAGSQTLQVLFTPTDTTDYATATATVTLVVNKATSVLTWATPAPITYGTALSGTQLDAVASVTGTFTYIPAAGTVLHAGSQTLQVLFTPTDTTDYATATATVTLVVNQATSVLTWAIPAPITYGTALSGAQLDAVASVPGTFAYTPSTGTILSAGFQTLQVLFTPTDTTDYKTATATVALAVNQATPVLTWATPAPITYGTALSGTQLNAGASVPGTFVYNPAVGTVLTAGSHTLNVTFTPTDTTDYTTATTTVTLTIAKAVLTVTAGSAPMTYGGTLPTFTANYSGFVPGDTQSVLTGSPQFSIAPATAASPAGSYPINVAQGTLSAANYTFNFVSGTLTIAKAVLTVNASPASKIYGAAMPTLAASYSGFVNGDSASTVIISGTPAFATPVTINSAVGVYPITLSGVNTLSAANYTFAGPTPAQLFTVNPAPLSFTADSLSVAQGASQPPLTYTITGLKNGDTFASVFTGAPSLSLPENTAFVAEFLYTITITAGTLKFNTTPPNYLFPTFVNGIMTVFIDQQF
jgi:sugar lactone lactonase YvrE